MTLRFLQPEAPVAASPPTSAEGDGGLSDIRTNAGKLLLTSVALVAPSFSLATLVSLF